MNLKNYHQKQTVKGTRLDVHRQLELLRAKTSVDSYCVLVTIAAIYIPARILRSWRDKTK